MTERPTSDEARDWLKESGITPDLSITWSRGDRDDGGYRRLLEILFSTRPEDRAA